MGTPHPYLEQDAIDFLSSSKKITDEVIEREILPKLSSLGAESRATEDSSIDAEDDAEARNAILANAENFLLSAPPIKAIREVKEDGTEVYIGNVALIRKIYRDVEDEQERERLKGLNYAMPPGDPKIIWSLGCKYAWSKHASVVETK